MHGVLLTCVCWLLLSALTVVPLTVTVSAGAATGVMVMQLPSVK